MAPSYEIPALVRTFDVIDYISKTPHGVTFSEIVTALQAPKASIFRILHTLEKHGWVEKKSDRYHLDYMLIHYGMLAHSRRDLSQVAQPYLLELTEELGESSHLAMLSGKQSMLAAVCESKNHIKLSSPVGTLLPLNCTSHGKVFLTWTIAEPLETYLQDVTLEKRTRNSLVTIRQLQEETERIRSLGYALDNLEFYDDIRCCAAPVFDASGRCIAAVGITATNVRFPMRMIDSVAAKVVETATAISKAMGQ